MNHDHILANQRSRSSFGLTITDCIHRCWRPDRRGLHRQPDAAGQQSYRPDLYDGSVVGKWLEMLKEIDPRVTRAAFIINPKTSSFPLLARETETVAQSLLIELTLSTIENAG
jgi:hypothetical protein